MGLGEFWLGLDAIHALTKPSKTRLKIKMNWMNGNLDRQDSIVFYEGFSVADEASNYKLSIGT